MNSYAPIKVEDTSAAERDFHPTPPSVGDGSATSIDWFRQGPPPQYWESAAAARARLSRSVRGTERQRAKYEDEFPADLYYRSPITPPSLPMSGSLSKSKRIPRPPNAFILYRSNLLQQGHIPDTVECRQHTFSRVAGQCWNLLTPAQKKEWQQLAEERAAIHRLEYPDYNFKPSPRSKGKAKLRSNEEKSDDVIRLLRETYIGIQGPSICASRQRKPKAQVKEEQPAVETPASCPSTPIAPLIDTQDLSAHNWTPFAPQGVEEWPAVASDQSTPANTPSVSPFDTQGLEAYNWSSFPPSNSPSPSLPSPEPASNEAALPPCFPQRTFPHFVAPRRPSTSLGFVRRLDEDASCFEPGHGLERPASAASDTGLTALVRDLNITPTSATFGHISTPATPDVYGSLADQTNILSPFPFTALDGHDGAPFPDLSNGVSTFPNVQFPMALDESYGFSNDPFFFDNWSFEDINQLMGAGNQ
ncbi:hypothetical protein DFH07DRAFT_25304 [Mycena maculata]|uniref:HMG box domain-containing protein n=1 Tax=Mycena maculata TaxID=230809 RepID=A0AAD7N4V9_9AGAR|nr:hypothetical protein DFH07DRAFT_25304 [Mycena maculata]